MHPAHIVQCFSLLLSLLISFYYRFVFSKLEPTRTGPSTGEPFTLLAALSIACFRYAVMLFKRVFAEAFKVVGTMRWDIVKAFTLAFGSLTGGFISFGIEILMIFELVVTETLGFWTNHFALGSFGVVPAQVKAIFAFF